MTKFHQLKPILWSPWYFCHSHFNVGHCYFTIKEYERLLLITLPSSVECQSTGFWIPQSQVYQTDPHPSWQPCFDIHPLRSLHSLFLDVEKKKTVQCPSGINNKMMWYKHFLHSVCVCVCLCVSVCVHFF